jgi:hypothetical protein
MPRRKEHEHVQVQAVQDNDEDGDLSSSGGDDEEEDLSGSPSGTLGPTSGPSSQMGGDGGNQSTCLAHLRDMPYLSPLLSPLCMSFLESGEEELDALAESLLSPFVPCRPPITSVQPT